MKISALLIGLLCTNSFAFPLNLQSVGAAGFPNGREIEASVAALNTVIHSLSTLPGMIPLDFQKVRGGKTEYNVNGFLKKEALEIIAAADPTMACTGSIRINKLLAALTEPKTYNALIGALNSRDDIIRQYGILIDDSTASKMGVNQDGRRIEITAFNSQRGKAYRVGYFFDPSATTTQADVERWIVPAPNGFRREFIVTPAGKIVEIYPAELNPAPSEIVRAPWTSCLECSMQLGSSEMPDWMQGDSVAVRQAFRNAKAIFSTAKDSKFPVVQEMNRGFHEPLDAAMAAKELGANAKDLRQFVPTTITREAFETRFCEIKAKLEEIKGTAHNGAAGVSNPAVSRREH